MVTFTAAKVLPNLTRWEVDDWEPREKAGWGIATIVVRTPAATNYNLTCKVFIRDAAVGSTGRASYAAVVGGDLASHLRVDVSALNLATGFTAAHAAYISGGAGRTARLRALELHLLSAGIADASMAGA
jgi:hypothetical protein